jgi:hypothetical protein
MAYTSKAAASLGFANRNFVLQLNHLKVNFAKICSNGCFC